MKLQIWIFYFAVVSLFTFHAVASIDVDANGIQQEVVVIKSDSFRDRVLYETAFGEEPDTMQIGTYKHFKKYFPGSKMCLQNQSAVLEFDLVGNLVQSNFDTDNGRFYYKLMFAGSNSAYVIKFNSETWFEHSD